MKNNRLWRLATELTVQKLGPMDDHIDSDDWDRYREGAYSGLMEMLSLVTPLLNQARSNGQRPQKPDQLRNEINSFEESIGFEKTFLTNHEAYDRIRGNNEN